MRSFATADTPARTLYSLVTNLIVPRPIALVSSRDAGGHANLAPFSFFNAVSDQPPTLAFSVGSREGEKKDTVRNIEAHPEFIVHLVGEDLVPRMNAASANFPRGVDEFEEVGFRKVPGTLVDVPRVAEAPVALECRLLTIVPIGRSPEVTSHVIGEIVYWHLSDALWNDDRLVTRPMRPVGRLGPAEYSRLDDRFILRRPNPTVR